MRILSDKHFEIDGGKVLVFGDLHLSAVYTGKHKNYTKECYYTMSKIEDIVEEEKPSAVFFLGDIIGVNERNIKDHQFLMRVILFFKKIDSVTCGNVYTVKGNHDIGDFSDFDLLVGLNLLKNPDYVDYVINGELELRFHFVNYGHENRTLHLAGEDDCASNIVLGHNDYYVNGVTTWYSSKGGVEVKKLGNMKGIEMILSGHIHEPSSEFIYESFDSDNTVGIFYLGSPSRTAERIEKCWYMSFEYIEDEGTTGYNANEIKLLPVEESFFDEEEFITENDSEEVERTKALQDIISQIIDGRITTGNIYHQIDVVPGVNQNIKDIAKSYLEKAGS